MKGDNGELLVSEEQVSDRWREYFEKLLNEENEWNDELSAEYVEEPADMISKEEVRQAIQDLKVRKAAGPSGVTGEMINVINAVALKGLTTTTTIIYFNKVVFPSVLGLISPMAFPQHSPPPSPVPSIFLTKSLLSHIFFQHFSPSLSGPTFHSITIYLQCLNSLYPTQLISPLNMAKPSQPVPSHGFSNIINCQHAPHTLITFPFI